MPARGMSGARNIAHVPTVQPPSQPCFTTRSPGARRCARANKHHHATAARRPRRLTVRLRSMHEGSRPISRAPIPYSPPKFRKIMRLHRPLYRFSTFFLAAARRATATIEDRSCISSDASGQVNSQRPRFSAVSLYSFPRLRSGKSASIASNFCTPALSRMSMSGHWSATRRTAMALRAFANLAAIHASSAKFRPP